MQGSEALGNVVLVQQIAFRVDEHGRGQPGSLQQCLHLRKIRRADIVEDSHVARLEKFPLSFRPLACLRGATLAFAVDVHHQPQGILRNGTQAVAQAAVFQILRQADGAPGEGFEGFFFAAPAAGCENGEEKEEEKKKEDAFHFEVGGAGVSWEEYVLQETSFLLGQVTRNF